jgi:hypothetical protein
MVSMAKLYRIRSGTVGSFFRYELPAIGIMQLRHCER